MKATYLGIALLAAGLLLPGLPVADDNSRMEQVEILFRLTRMEQKVNESVESVAQLQLRQNPELEHKRDLLMAFLQRQIGWDALKADLAAMYLQAFSEEELERINAFYISPTGQKVITVVPQLVQQRNQLAMQRLQQHIGELQQLMSNGQPGR
jgi:hypothetical protein